MPRPSWCCEGAPPRRWRRCTEASPAVTGAATGGATAAARWDAVVKHTTAAGVLRWTVALAAMECRRGCNEASSLGPRSRKPIKPKPKPKAGSTLHLELRRRRWRWRILGRGTPTTAWLAAATAASPTPASHPSPPPPRAPAPAPPAPTPSSPSPCPRRPRHPTPGTAGSPPTRCAASRSSSPSTPPTPPWSSPWASSRGVSASSPTPSTSPSAAACSPSPSSPWPPPAPTPTPPTPTGTRDWRSSPPSSMPQLFLLFLSFSLAVEALHSFMQDESEHKHYLIVSAVTNLLVNLLGVWFFRSYARVNIGMQVIDILAVSGIDVGVYILQLFLLFLSFSLAVEALHSFMQDESEHKHYLIVSAVTNLLVNLLGIWFFRSYARVNIDSVRSAGLILASWFLSLGIENAEVLCLGIVSVAVFMLVMPLFKATGNVLLQIAPGNVPPSAFIKCVRQITACEDVSEVSQARFWELVPGHAVGCLSIRVKSGSDDQSVLEYVHGLYEDLGIHDLTIQTEES